MVDTKRAADEGVEAGHAMGGIGGIGGIGRPVSHFCESVQMALVAAAARSGSQKIEWRTARRLVLPAARALKPVVGAAGVLGHQWKKIGRHRRAKVSVTMKTSLFISRCS